MGPVLEATIAISSHVRASSGLKPLPPYVHEPALALTILLQWLLSCAWMSFNIGVYPGTHTLQSLILYTMASFGLLCAYYSVV